MLTECRHLNAILRRVHHHHRWQPKADTLTTHQHSFCHAVPQAHSGTSETRLREYAVDKKGTFEFRICPCAPTTIPVSRNVSKLSPKQSPLPDRDALPDKWQVCRHSRTWRQTLWAEAQLGQLDPRPGLKASRRDRTTTATHSSSSSSSLNNSSPRTQTAVHPRYRADFGVTRCCHLGRNEIFEIRLHPCRLPNYHM